MKLELTANDAPYYQASNIPAVVTVGAVELVLPLLEPAAAGPTGSPAPGGAPAAPAGQLPATGASPSLAPPLVLLLLAAGARTVLRLCRW